MNLLKELCTKENEVATLMIDNVFALNLANNPIAHGRSKHIEMRFHNLRKFVSEGKLKLKYNKSEDQVVNLLTKGVSLEVFIRLKKHMSMKDLNQCGVLKKVIQVERI